VIACVRPLDPLDAEAVASGAEPVIAPDAALHAASCEACGAAVAGAGQLLTALERLPLPAPAGLVDRVLRLRPFSRSEKRRVRLWAPPALLSGLLFTGGLFSATLPGVTAGDRAGVGLAAAIPLASFLRSGLRWLSEMAAAAPRGLEALATALGGQTGIGLAALLLLLPAALGFRRVLARAASRR
jgi:hypothetical protein